jgi:hypothetical protein
VTRWTVFQKRLILILALLAAAVPAMATASDINIFVAPDNTYQNTANNPCVFYGPGGCPSDPAGWLDPASPTNGDFTTLTQTYTGTYFDGASGSWIDIVGDTFILGLDINDQGGATGTQTLDPFTISFFGASSNLLGSYTLASPTAVPGVSNGTGYADYILAAGCSGTVSDVLTSDFNACSTYLPFVLPSGTASIQMTFGYTTGNDGPDKVFAIPMESSTVPEPASLFLFGVGAAAVAARRRFAAR